MKVTINQLDEEISSKNADLIIQQLREKNSQQQKLINKYQTSNSAKRISVSSQTGNVRINYTGYIFKPGCAVWPAQPGFL